MELKKFLKRAQWGNLLNLFVRAIFFEKVDPAVLRFDPSNFREILAKHQFISIIVFVGSGLVIALCCPNTIAQHLVGSEGPVQASH